MRPRSDRQGYDLRAAAQASFLTRAVLHRRKRRAAAHVQCADPLGGVTLVPGDRQEIDAELIDVHRELAERLRGVDVQRHFALAAMCR